MTSGTGTCSVTANKAATATTAARLGGGHGQGHASHPDDHGGNDVLPARRTTAVHGRRHGQLGLRWLQFLGIVHDCRCDLYDDERHGYLLGDRQPGGDTNYNAASEVNETVNATLASQTTLTVTGVPATAQAYGASLTVAVGRFGHGTVTFSAPEPAR